MAVCVLWVRSCRQDDHYGRSRVVVTAGTAGGVTVERWGAFSSTGRVTFGGAAYTYTPAEYAAYVSPTPPAAVDRVGWSSGRLYGYEEYYGHRDETPWLGFGSNGAGPFGVCGPGDTYGVSSVPHGFLAFMFAVPPLWLLAAVCRVRGYSARRATVLYAGLVAVGMLMCNANGPCVCVLPVAASGAVVAYIVYRAVQLPGRADRRFAAGLCPACGYDVRATPRNGGPRFAKCPECGAETTAPTSVAGRHDRAGRPARE